MANPQTYQAQRFPPIIGQHSSDSDFEQISYSSFFGTPGTIVQIPSLNNYNLYWNGISTANNGRVQADPGEYYKGYLVFSNDDRNLLKDATGTQIIGISGSTYRIHSIERPSIELNQSTEIAASGALTEEFKLLASRSLNFDITIKRNPV